MPVLTMEQMPAITGSTPPMPNTQLAVQAMALAQADMTIVKAHEVMKHHTYAGREATEPELQAAWAICKREIFETEDTSETARPELVTEEKSLSHSPSTGASGSGVPRQ